MYSQTSSPAGPPSSTATVTAKPAPLAKRKIQALGADYGSDDDSDEEEEEEKAEKKTSGVLVTGETADDEDEVAKKRQKVAER